MNNETENIPKKFEILPSFWLVLLGAPSFLVAGYFGYMFQDAIPGFIKTTNSEGFTIDFLESVWHLYLIQRLPGFVPVLLLAVTMFYISGGLKIGKVNKRKHSKTVDAVCT